MGCGPSEETVMAAGRFSADCIDSVTRIFLCFCPCQILLGTAFFIIDSVVEVNRVRGLRGASKTGGRQAGCQTGSFSPSSGRLELLELELEVYSYGPFYLLDSLATAGSFFKFRDCF